MATDDVITTNDDIITATYNVIHTICIDLHKFIFWNYKWEY